VIASVIVTGCSGAPGTDGLRDSFAQQIGAIAVIHDFQRSGDELTFTGPFETANDAKWRVHIDSAVVERQTDQAKPYKGTVKSTWSANGQRIVPSATESFLPIQFLDKGLSQDCWAFWESPANRWSWE